MAPNRYHSTCVRCQKPVAAGSGEFRNDGSRWIVRHAGGHCHSVLYTSYVAEESLEWQQRRRARMEYAGFRCEWHGLLSGRCPAVGPLDCHHRHYRSLGHEPLRDLVVLCPSHHAIADSRRRAWGQWPLFGRPFWSSVPAPVGPGTPPPPPPPAAPTPPPPPPPPNPPASGSTVAGR
ncbi:MAG: hypothetical protein L3J73_01395 [Thermoplasmata archaeon]|nr:hypothetical protein [Thermoplasmata archaeon]